ncbi:hypothetical protein V2J09_003837, partial [Rumex salicifolius]
VSFRLESLFGISRSQILSLPKTYSLPLFVIVVPGEIASNDKMILHAILECQDIAVTWEGSDLRDWTISRSFTSFADVVRTLFSCQGEELNGIVIREHNKRLVIDYSSQLAKQAYINP